MRKTSNKPTRKAVATGGILITACAVCCAPLVIPFVAVFFAASGVGLALAGQIGLGIAAIGAVGGYLYLRRRAASKRSNSCGCGPSDGCGDASQVQRDERA